SVVAMDRGHSSPYRPWCCHAPPGKQMVLRQNRAGHTHACRCRARGFERKIETNHDAAEHVDRDSKPRSCEWLAINLVNQDQIQFRVIDLHDRKRPVSRGEMALDGLELFPGGAVSEPALKKHSRLDTGDSV